MTNFSHHALHKAIYQKLTEDATLINAVNGVFDLVPQGQEYPYITIGESTTSDWSTNTTTGTEHLLTIHVWSREGGKKETELLMERIHTLLHDGSLTIDDQTLVLSRFQSSSIELEGDGWTNHGRMRFRMLLEAD
ncbi:MAG: DUF3168 domain-containing protein [Rickettsiales bacterium]